MNIFRAQAARIGLRVRGRRLPVAEHVIPVRARHPLWYQGTGLPAGAAFDHLGGAQRRRAGGVHLRARPEGAGLAPAHPRRVF